MPPPAPSSPTFGPRAGPPSRAARSCRSPISETASRRPDAGRRALALALLAAFLVATRVLARPRSFWEWDDYIFGLALHLFAPQAGVPQAPFFPAFIFAARGLRPFVRDDVAALTWISVLASIAALPLMYGFVRELFPGSRRLSLAATVVYAFLPPVWFYAGIPISDTAGATAALLVLWLALRAMKDSRFLPAAFAAFGLGCGVRPQSLLVALVPLGVATWRSGARQRALAGAAALAAGLAFWLVPVARAAGGPGALAASFRERFHYVVSTTASFTGVDARYLLRRWLRDIWVTTAAAAAVGVLSIAGIVALAQTADRRRLSLLVGVALPYAAVFGVFLDSTFSGRYCLPLMPVVAVLVAAGAGAIERRLGLERIPFATGAIAIAGILLLAPSIFILHERVTPAEEAAAKLKSLAGNAPFALLYPREMYAPTALIFPGVTMFAAGEMSPDAIRKATSLPVWRFGVGSMTDPEEVACWPALSPFLRLTPGRYLAVAFGPWSRATPDFGSGWSSERIETVRDGGCRTRVFRWMERQANVSFPGLEGGATLELEAERDSPGAPGSIDLEMNGRGIARLAAEKLRISARVAISPEVLRRTEKNELSLREEVPTSGGAGRFRVRLLRLAPD